MDADIRRARKDYGKLYDQMRWLSPAAAQAAEQYRRELIERIFSMPGTAAGWCFSGTKLYTHDISPGCRLCGQGHWSCLFINGVCNAACFYCPSSQKDTGPPVTSAVEFARARDYADYVRAFGIKGVGFSGGEPLINFDRVTEYLRTLRTKVNEPVYTWMYTNGILVTEDKLKTLRDLGLDEIRFDLSAVDYDLSGITKAINVIPAVTVEIPAIPDDLEKTKSLVGRLYDLGVNYLNLHQIRCTMFNAPKLIQKGYTFVHGPGVAVLETELTALELIQYALENGIGLPVNYCSFTYRNQFQKAAARNRNARLVKKEWEDATATGFIRNLRLAGPAERIKSVREQLQNSGEEGRDWFVSPKGDFIELPVRLMSKTDLSDLKLKVKYSATALRSSASMMYPHTPIRLNEERDVIIERDDRHSGILLEGEPIRIFAEKIAETPGSQNGSAARLHEKLEAQINRFESFSQNLAPYN